MDIKGKLVSKSKKSIELKSINGKKSKLKSRDKIGEQLKLQRDYTDDDFIFPKNFLKSMIDHKNLFTNMVTTHKVKNHVNEHIIHNLKLMLNDPAGLVKNTEQIEINYHNRKRLFSIISNYDKTAIDENGVEGINLFKVSGKRTIVKIGKKEEYIDAFRVYLKITDDNRYYMIFIDPYHLAIPSWHNGKSPEVVRQQTFRQYSYYKNHIYDLLIQVDK